MDFEQNQNHTLNIVADVVRALIFGVASATHSDPVKVADVMKAFADAPDFDPKARTILKSLAEELEPLRREPSSL